MSNKTILGTVLLACLPLGLFGQEKPSGLEPDVLFCIGWPDVSCNELALARSGGFPAYPDQFPNGKVEFIVGKSKPEADWPYIHPGPADRGWAKGEPVHPFSIKLNAVPNPEPLTFVIGYCGSYDVQLSQVEVTVNETALPIQIPKPVGHAHLAHDPVHWGQAGSMLFTIPAGTLKDGINDVTIRLLDKSWFVYDYVALRTANQPLVIRPRPEVDLLTPFRAGPMKDVQKVVFAARGIGVEHWYANFGYYAHDEKQLPFPFKGGKLCILDLDSLEVQTLLDDPQGGVRDPVVHYDAEKILFSYRPGDSKSYNLYEINVDGSGLRQLTTGEFDDIEPTYLPDGDIMFVSSRAKRWVNCWLTPVAVLYRCDADGGNIREISSNIEHDNTPWVLPNGQVIYTRWEYVDRSQVHYHHLWITSPDGSRQMVLYGNQNGGNVMIDAKPIPGSDKIVASFSPGHGLSEHAGVITIVDPRLGPDNRKATKSVGRHTNHRDPWAFSETAFLAANDAKMMLIDEFGDEQTIYELPEEQRKLGLRLHEPRPLIKRQRERIIPEQVDWAKTTGELTLINVYDGRNMTGIPHGSIKKLLVLETLPKPINFTGGMEPLTYGGSFTLERIIGTVPVEEDGSAFMELPALRSFFFVALDENDLSVKRMQSFLTVMPGESTTCIGCHENRTATPRPTTPTLLATRRPPSQPVPYAEISDVIDYPRDVQPVWDRNCVSCHNSQKRDGTVSMVGDRTPLYSISYYTITAKALVADGRNLPQSNYPPYSLGTSASKLLQYCDESHYGVNLTDRERQIVKLWIETGAAYPGTYAGLGSGMIGGYAANSIDRRDLKWPEMKAAMEVLPRRCAECHTAEKGMPLPLSPTDEVGGAPWESMSRNDIRRKYSRQLLYNLTNPQDSVLLLAPLTKSAGGYESCGRAIFENTDDPDYRIVLAAIERTKRELDEIKRFDMPGFIPRPQYVREMKKYGILPQDADPNQAFDTYQLDRDYWKSLWYQP